MRLKSTITKNNSQNYSSVYFNLRVFLSASKTKKGSKYFQNLKTGIQPLLSIAHNVIST